MPDMPKPRVDLRLRDLCDWHIIRIQCGACRHVGVVSPRSLLRRWAPDVRFQAIEHRLRCVACGWRGGHAWAVAKLPRNT